MNWRSHAFIGFTASAIALFFIFKVDNIFSMMILALFGLISALVPDLDHNDSKGKQILDAGIVAIVTSSLLFSSCGSQFCIPTIGSFQSMIISALAIFGAYFLLFLFFKPTHRGITHTVAACSVYSVLIYMVLGLDFAFAGFIGYFSHLAADTHIRIV